MQDFKDVKREFEVALSAVTNEAQLTQVLEQFYKKHKFDEYDFDENVSIRDIVMNVCETYALKGDINKILIIMQHNFFDNDEFNDEYNIYIAERIWSNPQLFDVGMELVKRMYESIMVSSNFEPCDKAEKIENIVGTKSYVFFKSREFISETINAVKVIYESIMVSSNLKPFDKAKKILKIVHTMSSCDQIYKSEEFISESKNAIMKAFNLEEKASSMLEFFSIVDSESHWGLGLDRIRYIDLLHDMALKTFKEFVKSGEYTTVDNNGFKSFAVLVDNYMLKEQETVENGENLYALYDAEFKLRKEQGVFAAMEPAFILLFLDSLAFGEAVDVCQRRMQEVRSLICFDPEGDRAVQSALEDLFFYFFATCDEEIMTSIVHRIHPAATLRMTYNFFNVVSRKNCGIAKEQLLLCIGRILQYKKDELIDMMRQEKSKNRKKEYQKFLVNCGIA